MAVFTCRIAPALLLIAAAAANEWKPRGSPTFREQDGQLLLDCEADENQPGCNFFLADDGLPSPPAVRFLRPYNNAQIALRNGATGVPITLQMEVYSPFPDQQYFLDVFLNNAIIARLPANVTTTHVIMSTRVRTKPIPEGEHVFHAVLVGQNRTDLGPYAELKVSVRQQDKLTGKPNWSDIIHGINDTARLTYRHDNRMELFPIFNNLHPVRTVCETGFWQGGSARTWLSNPEVEKVYSFDIKVEWHIAQQLWNDFGKDRLEIIEGDSFYTIPDFVKSHPDVVCDLVLVDGDHFDELPWSDMRNFQKMANENTILYADDCGHGTACLWCAETAQSFNRMMAERRLHELARISTTEGNHEEGYGPNIGANHHTCIGRYAFGDNWGTFVRSGPSSEQQGLWDKARHGADFDVLGIHPHALPSYPEARLDTGPKDI